jgi:hypothetical protein
MENYPLLTSLRDRNAKDQVSSPEADSHSASQEIPRLFWNPTIHYRVHTSHHCILYSVT